MDTKKEKIPFLPGWILAAVLFALGVFVYYCVLGCSFSGQLLWCFGALVLVYQCINLLSLKNKKTAKILRRILTVCVCIGFLIAAVTGCFIIHAAFGDAAQDCDYIVVLGAGVNGTVPSLSLRERINAAYDYLTAHPDSVAVVSGGKGNGEDITEALCMYNELTKMGIDGSRVWMEDQATSTFENLKFSMALIEAQTGARPASVGIVSSEYHLFRAGLFADAQNVESLGIPATTTWPHLRVNYFIREIIAVWHYIVFGG